MDFMKVDKEKCTACAVCTETCPVQILKMDDKKKMPVPVDNAEELCIKCGHCVCVCPYGALSLESNPIDELQVLDSGWRINEERLEVFLKARRSIRKFKKEIVEKETIEKLIDIARYAPTGLNRQPVRWMAVHDPEVTHKLASSVIEWMRNLVKAKDPLAESLHMDISVQSWDQGYDRICRGAPHIVIGYALKENKMAAADAAIAFTYLDLAAVSMGIGSCWAGYAVMAINSSDQVRKVLGLSKRSACFAAMLLGYPKYEYKRIPKRNSPKINWK